MTSPAGHRGLTLAELLIAAFILSVSISGVLLLFSNSIVSSELAWDSTIATSHAETILEEMKSLPELSEISNTDWAQWAFARGLNTLPEEKVSVVFSGGPAADPLDIEVNVSWLRKGRYTGVALRTKMTR